MKEKLIPLEHPGVFLKEEFMDPLNVTAYRLAKETRVSAMTISEILRGKRGISPKVGLKLSKFFGMSEGYFVRLQIQYDIDRIKESDGEELKKIHAIA
jgi:antitoxin HigA-1